MRWTTVEKFGNKAQSSQPMTSKPAVLTPL